MAKAEGQKKKAKKDKRKNIWNIHGLEKRTQELIHGGLLKEKDGLARICEAINAEFVDKIGENQPLTQKALSAQLDELIWTKGVEGDLWRCHSNGIMEQFRAVYVWIPEYLIRERERQLKGVTHSTSTAQFKAGMGRLNISDLPRDAEKFEFPDISFKKPYVVSDKSEGQVAVINGALFGIKYLDIKRNTLRRALADARKRGADAVILTNLMELWTKRTAGYMAVYRAIVSGIHINPDRFPPDYQQEVRDILDGKITDKMIYQTLNERVEEILDGLDKVTHRPDDKGGKESEFPGQVLVLLCAKEEELINAATYYEGRYLSIVEINKLDAALKMASRELDKAKRAHNVGRISFWSKEQARLGARKARAILTNHTGSQYEKYRRRMRAYIVKRLQETIPNCKVISQGGTYIKVADKVVRLHIPSDDKVTDARLADLGDVYGAELFRNQLADLTISCPAYSLNHRYVGREDSIDNKPVTKFLATAPSCVDGEFLRREFKDVSKLAHPVQELVFSPQFKPGVLLLNWADGILNFDSLPIEKLDRVEQVAEGSNFAYPYPDVKYMIWFRNTDNHFGAPDKRFIYDPKERIHMGATQAAQQMMRRSGLLNENDIRIHCTAEMDDATQGDLWFKQRYRPDPNLMAISHFERLLRQLTGDIQKAAEKGDTKAVHQIADDVNRISMSQLYLRGEDFPFHQMMQVFDRHLDPQVDFYGAVVGRFLKSGISIRGISKLQNTIYDTRDLGVINFPEGNHRINTLEQADLEGDYMALRLQDRIAQTPQWQSFIRKNPKFLQERPEFLKEAIRAPRFGNVTFGWGLMQAPGGYPWGVRVHATPARQSGWSDILAAVIKNDIARGDDSYGLSKNVTVTFYGDKHFYAYAETERMIYSMCAAGVHTNTYGSTGGFPPNNTGVDFFCMPADGPDAGPILVRRLPHDFLRDWFANPKPFNWDKFLPNPV